MEYLKGEEEIERPKILSMRRLERRIENSP